MDNEDIDLYRNLVKRLLKEKDGSEISNGFLEHAAILFEQFFENANEKVRIFSHRLLESVYGKDFVVQAATNAMVKGTVVIDVLVQNEPDDSEFFRLSKKYPGKFFISRVEQKFQDEEINFATMDKTAYRFEPNKNELKATASMYDEATTGKMINAFERVKASATFIV